MRKNKSILMHFESEHDLLHGIDVLQQYKISINEVYSPKNIRGLDQKLKIKEIKTGLAILKFGCLGGAALSTFLYYILQHGITFSLDSESLMGLMLNLVVMLVTFVLAMQLFPAKAPKLFKIKSRDHRFLVVIKSNHVTSDENVSNLLKYSEAVELSPSIKDMIAS
ncbi:quinol:electron acceptor oxidoreductase subunit ActD [Pedobacter psychrodurus]|uniref:quinol:electron acceptor oxidoreductase subunit ActD n=1 Tax=Pedobacter psychrodurus TaxID=2530456 RepID=UPI00292D4136|nr:quinol:electron acceptor oxidoreductase subunit ActD [Pedobacter psychrodurus]